MIDFKKYRPEPDQYILRYGGAMLAVLLVMLITLGVSVFFTLIVSPLFLAAVFFSAWWGGLRPAFLATVISGMLIDYFFVPPFYDFSLSIGEIARFVIFSIEGFLFSWLFTSRLLIIEEITDSREQIRSLALRQETLREEERKRIALEIHDELGQSLTGLKMEFHFLNKNLKQHVNESGIAPISEEITEIQKTIDSTVSTIRRISTELRPPIIDDLGLIAALEWQSSEFQRRTGVTCKLETDLESIEIDSNAAIAVFRIFQESLTNIMRHAEATSVKVMLSQIGKIINLSIEDNGVGIQPNKMKNKTSLGILGMKERARLIGGNIAINSNEVTGTQINLTFPI